MVLFVPAPIETVSAVRARTSSFSQRESASAPPRAAACSLASRNASSSDSGSTRGVTERKIVMTWRDSSP